MESSRASKLALITGASSGIGLELARLFARDGYALVLAADDAAGLDAARTDLLAAGAPRVETVPGDLATPEANDRVYEAARAIGPVDALVANAGHGAGGLFATETDLADELNLIGVNVVSLVVLAKHAARDMAARGAGKILVTGSIAGTAPGPYQAVYHASKAFANSFAQGIRNELKDAGVTVTVLMPGATETDFFERADMEDTKVGQMKKADPADVAKAGYDALMAGDDHVVPGLLNKAQAVVSEIVPDAVGARLTRPQNEPAA